MSHREIQTGMIRSPEDIMVDDDEVSGDVISFVEDILLYAFIVANSNRERWDSLDRAQQYQTDEYKDMDLRAPRLSSLHLDLLLSPLDQNFPFVSREKKCVGRGRRRQDDLIAFSWVNQKPKPVYEETVTFESGQLICLWSLNISLYDGLTLISEGTILLNRLF